MIRLNLNRLTFQKGITKPIGYLRTIGIRYETAKHYMGGRQKTLKLIDIEKLCMALHCTPNDLLEWHQSEHDAPLPATHPLAALHRAEPKANIGQLLLNASPEKLMEVQKLLLGDE